jgi:hypothetical protein
MIRFFLFYFLVLNYRVFRLLYRPKITGNTNYLATPLLTLHRLMQHPALFGKWTFVDVGCGEGLAGMYLRLIRKKSVILIDNQYDFLRLIQVLSWSLLISNVRLTSHIQYLQDTPKRHLTCFPGFLGFRRVLNSQRRVVLLVWTSWSRQNRANVLAQLSDAITTGDMLISVSHGIVHPLLVEIDKITEIFAWGKAKVYYYRHA